MTKWKLFGRKKENIQTETKVENTEIKETEETQPLVEVEKESNENQEESPILEYKETLYSRGTEPKSHKKKDQKTWKRTTWENVDTIEGNIDRLDKKKAYYSEDGKDIEKKIDDIIGVKHVGHRKPSNVIYVVSRPQPGQRRGDWAVRGHGKIYSHHRKKRSAIQAARQIAKEKDATVMIQKTDGTFSRGFKPKSK